MNLFLYFFLLKLFIPSLVVFIIILMSSYGGCYPVFQITSLLLPYLEGMKKKQYFWKPQAEMQATHRLLCAELWGIWGHNQEGKARRLAIITPNDPDIPGTEPHSSQGEPGFALPQLSCGQGNVLCGVKTILRSDSKGTYEVTESRFGYRD